MKRWCAAILAVLFALVCGAVLLRMDAQEVIGWGLSFGGEIPAGPQSPQKLAQLGGAYVDPDGGKVIYLTFDAGYENGFTEQILDILKQQQVPAAFFLVGDYLERNADLVRRMTEEGHIVGNHTATHPDMSKLEFDGFRRELEQVEALYTQITGQTMPKYYRPPQGVYSEENLKWAQELGYNTVFWSLAHVDWDNDHQPDPDAAVEKLTGRLHEGAVVLLHSSSKTNAEILDRLITRWKDLGYRFAPLTELFGGP